MKALLNRWFGARLFSGSAQYWEQRYLEGGTSGSGSSGALARFKADFLNGFVERHAIHSVVEFGCGDGRQLALARYPAYTGIDVSQAAVALCRKLFEGQQQFRFFTFDDRPGYAGQYDLALSIDVILHLVEDAVFDTYMRELFAAASRFVVVYSSNFDGAQRGSPHVRHRKFTDWIARNVPAWKSIERIDNPFPHEPARPSETSLADFYVFAPDE
ncbi:MAG: class I SAM-dependent methyltransferase [Alphaproteobacteria bacterium]|nr:class I SAM-dependent methyltransferase [Alphaproteobacteria bacterium]